MTVHPIRDEGWEPTVIDNVGYDGPVVASLARIPGIPRADLDERSFSHDQVLRFVVECVVTNVTFPISRKGEVERKHLLEVRDYRLLEPGDA